LRRSRGARELQVEALEAAQHVRGRVLVAARAGRAMLLLRDADVAQTVEQTLGADARLGAGQRRAGAAVDAEAEAEVLAPVRPIDPELGRIVEPARVAVRGCRKQHDDGAGRERDAADRRRDARETEGALQRALDAQTLLDEARDALALVAQQLLQV